MDGGGSAGLYSTSSTVALKLLRGVTKLNWDQFVKKKRQHLEGDSQSPPGGPVRFGQLAATHNSVGRNAILAFFFYVIFDVTLKASWFCKSTTSLEYNPIEF